MTYYLDIDYFVRFVDLPLSIGGFVMPNDDTTFSVYINARHTEARQLISYIHEVRHIQHDDFYNGKPIYIIEREASV